MSPRDDGQQWRLGQAGPLTRHTLLIALSYHIGKRCGIKGKELAALITRRYENADERHLRILIEDLRDEGHHICGTPVTGYYIAANEQELNETCEWLYKRSIGTLQRIAKMKNVALPDLRGQLRLPT